MGRLICPTCQEGCLEWRDRVPSSGEWDTAIMICEKCGAKTTMRELRDGIRAKEPPKAVDPWRSIDSAPYDTVVLLTGSSGCIAPHDHFILSGYRAKDWHGGHWNDIVGTSLSDYGWEPDGWLPIKESLNAILLHDKNR
jgi:hypothetical protein